MTEMRSRWRRRGPFSRRARRRGRGVSDVVATILLLALTVTLFASIFAFVTSFPAPPAQNNNQFQASLFYPSNGTITYIAGIRIVHLAGPLVPGNAMIYLKSAMQPAAPEFASGYSVSSGLGGAVTWNLGQTWSLTFPITEMPLSRGNMTIYIVSDSQLLFSVILPGSAIVAPPTVVSTSVSPAAPVVGQSFTVLASLAGNYLTDSVYVNLVSIPGCPSLPKQMTLNAQGEWAASCSGATHNGTYYGFVNASGLSGTGQTAIGPFTVTILNAGGATGSSQITVGVVAIPQPPSLVVGANYFAAVITYTGSLQKAALNVSFWVNQTPQKPFTSSHTTTHLYGPTTPPLTISGPSTTTVYSTWPVNFTAWLLNSSVWINASATITGVGSASGTSSLASPNYAPGVLTLLAGTPAGSTSPTDACVTVHTGSSTLCPFLNATVWDNWTSARGFPAGGTLSFAGVAYVVYGGTNGSNTQSYTISKTTLTSPSVAVDVAGAGVRWQPKTNAAWVAAVTLTVSLTTSSGTTIVGFIYDNLTGTS